MTIYEKYTEKLDNIPAPGEGCHPAILGVATLGVMAGLTDERIFSDIRAAIPPGNRYVPDSEIKDAIARARQDTKASENGGGQPPPPKKQRPTIRPDYRDRLIHTGREWSEERLRELSPVEIPDDPACHTQLFLQTLFEEDNYVFMGQRYDSDVRTVAQWLEILEREGADKYPHIGINSFTGKKHENKGGKPSYRCDAAVKEYRYALVEFDDLARHEQLAFWAAIPLPIVALIDTAGKSIHAWIRIFGIETSKQWDKCIRHELYGRRLSGIGVDTSCRNESRLSRTPGCRRDGKYQRLLYLAKEPLMPPLMWAGQESGA